MTTTTEPRPHRLVLFATAFAVVAADVVTKQWAVAHWSGEPVSLLNGWLILTESRNPGAAFGMATSATPVLAVIATAVVVSVVVFSRRYTTRRFAAAMGLILGGAAGNLADRLARPPGPLRGHVVDWIDIGAWPNFNLADSSLMVGCALLLLTFAQDNPRARTEGTT